MSDKSVYVVEDEGITAKQVKLYLEQMGNEVPFVTSAGEEALEEVRNNPPDLVLMDINLQGSLDGIEVTEQIAEETDVPVVFLTAYGDQQTVNRARESGAEGLILKPINREDLEWTVRGITGNSDISEDDFGGELFTEWISETLGQWVRPATPVAPTTTPA